MKKRLGGNGMGLDKDFWKTFEYNVGSFFVMKCGAGKQLAVVIGKFGGRYQVFRWNDNSRKWVGPVNAMKSGILGLMNLLPRPVIRRAGRSLREAALKLRKRIK